MRIKFEYIACLLFAAAVGKAPLPASAEPGAPVAVTATAAAPTVALPAAGAPVTPGYLLAPDDTLSVTVLNCTQLNTIVVVTPDGYINLPLLPAVSVTGESPEALEAKLTKLWSKYVIRPSVNVSVTQKHHQIVSVSGYVMRPGPDDLRPNMRVLDAIADAGGIVPEGDAALVAVTRRNGEKVVLDLTNPGVKAGTDVDLVVGEGDSIFVPQAVAKISVVGQVHNPGSYAFKDPMTVLDAVTAAGGVIVEDSDLKQATLTHDGVDRPLDLDALLKHGDLTANASLHAGDRILIPEPVRCYVFGAVQRPGFYITRDGDRVLDAIQACGGTVPQAMLKNVRLVRIAKDKATAMSSTINLETYFKKGDMACNPPIQAGDAIFVDSKSQTQTSDKIYGLLSGLNLLNLGAHIFSSGLGH